MKKSLFLLLTSPVILLGQFGNGDGITTDAQVGIVMEEVPIEGTPFMNQTYTLGETIINGKSKTTALVRYNAYYDSIELLDKTNTPHKLLRRKSIQAVFDGKTYKIHDFADGGRFREAYFNPLNRGEIKLPLRPKKIFIQADDPIAVMIHTTRPFTRIFPLIIS